MIEIVCIVLCQYSTNLSEMKQLRENINPQNILKKLEYINCPITLKETDFLA